MRSKYFESDDFETPIKDRFTLALRPVPHSTGFRTKFAIKKNTVILQDYFIPIFSRKEQVFYSLEMTDQYIQPEGHPFDKAMLGFEIQ